MSASEQVSDQMVRIEQELDKPSTPVGSLGVSKKIGPVSAKLGVALFGFRNGAVLGAFGRFEYSSSSTE